MANPQPDKFTRISNELFDALIRTKIPSEARQVLDFIIRKTYGYNKKEDQISTSQIMEATALNRKAIERARKTLRAMNLITTHINKGSRKASTTPKNRGSQILFYSFNKDYETWQLPPKTSQTTPKTRPQLPPKTRPPYITKDNTKDNTKDIKQGASSALCGKHVDNPEVKQAMDKVTKAGLNIYAMVYKAKQSMKQPKDWRFPDQVILRVCEAYHKEKDRIRQPWPWFIEVLKRESERWNAEQHEIESKTANKRAPFANSIKSIMGGAK